VIVVSTSGHCVNFPLCLPLGEAEEEVKALHAEDAFMRRIRRSFASFTLDTLRRHDLEDHAFAGATISCTR